MEPLRGKSWSQYTERRQRATDRCGEYKFHIFNAICARACLAILGYGNFGILKAETVLPKLITKKE